MKPANLVRAVRDSGGFLRRLTRRFHDLGADLIVANSLKSAVLGSAAARWANLPWVWHLHDRLSPTKGQREFLTAAAQLATTHPTARFAIVGQALFNDQGYADEIHALAQSLGLAQQVDFLGWVDDPTRVVDGFTALVHASPTAEPFGQVIIEAMARHVPVIATLGGGVGEILTGTAHSPIIAPGTAEQASLGQLVAPLDTFGAGYRHGPGPRRTGRRRTGGCGRVRLRVRTFHCGRDRRRLR